MKTIRFSIFITALVVLCSSVQAQKVSQYEDISYTLRNARLSDSASFKVTYAHEYKFDTTNNQSWKDIKVLLAGRQIQHFYSLYQRQKDSIHTIAEEKREIYFAFPELPDDAVPEACHIYTHYPEKGTRTVMEPITRLSTYEYKEEVLYPQWILSSDTLTVLSYQCKKATCRYRGRNWVAWYSEEIPLRSGPWKLGGLPGLILKAYDTQNHHVFECIGIEKLSQPVPVLKYFYGRAPRIRCSREAYLKAQKLFYEDHVNALRMLGYSVSTTDKDGNDIEKLPALNTQFEERLWAYSRTLPDSYRYKKLPYNPIELE